MQIKEEIKILWEGPFKVDDILNNEIDTKYDVTAEKQGLYQIYGSHPLYGNDVLVYIGRTKDKKGFQSRLKGRWVIEKGSDTENVQIYLGTIFSDRKKIEDDSDLIDKSEVLLINAMKPAYNSSNIQSADEDYINDNFILYNEGNYRNLYPVLDSKYFWQPYKNFAIINELAEVYGVKKVDDKDFYYGFILNKETEVIDQYTLWLCVDYEIWNTGKIPLTIQIASENKEINKTLKKNKKIKKYKYLDDEYEEFYYYEVIDKFLNLDRATLKKACDSEINEIKNMLIKQT